MAQSPESNTDTADSAYAKSWDALGALIAQGKSFSGRERNCAFLNLGEKVPSFACASGAVNLDQMDDSRAIIPADWDGDGDLDLWYSNRTAPRLRFLRNDMVSGRHWLALQLEGRTCNRDAIGARAELTLVAKDGTKRTLWRRVKAGDGFLSQTPKTLHFGFREDETIGNLLVRWPAPGLDEVILPDVHPDQLYKITQGAGPELMNRTKALPLAAGAAVLPEEKEAVRAVLVNRLPVPKLDYVDLQGRQQSVGGGPLDKPTLILLWGSWCARCRAEMTELTAQAAALAGLRILALAVDTARENPDKKDIASGHRSLTDLRWPFDAGFATPEAVRGLAVLESKALYPERSLPLPTAYLLSPAGRIAFIYHGAVTPAQLAQDAALAAQTPADPETAAFPFPGRSARGLFPLTFAGQVQTLRDAGYLDDARRELQRQIAKPDSPGKATAFRLLADMEDEAGHPDEAVAAWQKAIALTPDDAATRMALAATLWKAKRPGESEAAFAGAAALAKDAAGFQNQIGKVWQTLGEHTKARDAFVACIAVAPDNIEALFNLAVTRQQSGDIAGAILGYETVLHRKPDLLDAGSNLAWLLATAKDSKLRDAGRALTLAMQINNAAAGRSPAVLDNLAAAHAAGGNYPQAAATAQEALALALASGEAPLAADIRQHLAAYQRGQPWIE